MANCHFDIPIVVFYEKVLASQTYVQLLPVFHGLHVVTLFSILALSREAFSAHVTLALLTFGHFLAQARLDVSKLTGYAGHQT